MSEAGTRYDNTEGHGFLVDDAPSLFESKATKASIVGRYMYLMDSVARGVNRQTLEPEESRREVTMKATFEMHLEKRLLIVDERRPDIDRIVERVEGFGSGHEIAVEGFNINAVAVYQALKAFEKDLEVVSIRVKDYLGREGLITTANFKLLEVGRIDEVFARFEHETMALGLKLPTPDGDVTLNITRKGSLRFSDDFPAGLIEEAVGMLALCEFDDEEK